VAQRSNQATAGSESGAGGNLGTYLTFLQ
jgi:hypothetical protein